MRLLSFLKPAPYLPEEKDSAVVNKQYRYWRIRIFYSMYIGYVFYYLTRKSFTFAMPSMIQEMGFDKSDLGILASILSITYGASKFASGILADRSNPRYFMAFGLILTGIFNIFFGMSSSLWFFAIFWGLNGVFQGWGWPPCARLLTHWYSRKERGTWWGFWSTSHSVGGFIIPLLAAVLAQYMGWRWAMYVPGIACIIVGFFLINRLRDTPRSLGLPSIEKHNDDYTGTDKQDDDETPPLKEILFKYIFKNRFIWMLAVSYFFVYVIRMAVNDWSMLYFVETKGYSQITSGLFVGFFEVGGIFGSFCSGWASDKLFGGRRGPVNALFCIGMVLAVIGLWLSSAPVIAIDAALMFAIGFLVFGPQMLIGMTAAELSHKKAAATATGFIGWIAYLGAAAAGYPLGKVTQEWGWEGFFISLGVCGIISVLSLLPLWSVQGYVKPGKPKEGKALPEAEEEQVLVGAGKSEKN